MLKSRNSGFSFVFGAIVLIAFAVILILVIPSFQPKPPIEVSSALDPSTIKENARSKLTLTFNNLDLRTHEIKILFDVSQRITIYEGNERPLEQNTYTFVLGASDPSEQRVFTIIGGLEAGILTAQYPLGFRVYVDDNELPKKWNDPILTIQKP